MTDDEYWHAVSDDCTGVPTDDEYWQTVSETARLIKSDHCTGVPDFYRQCCDEHDIGYRFGADLHGNPMTRADVDARFRRCIQRRSAFRCWSPMAWWRWAAVRVGGRRIWNRHRAQDHAWPKGRWDVSGFVGGTPDD